MISPFRLENQDVGPDQRHEIVKCKLGPRQLLDYERAERWTRRQISADPHLFQDQPFALLHRVRRAVGNGKVGRALHFAYNHLKKPSAKLVIAAHHIPVRREIAARLGRVAVQIEPMTWDRLGCVAHFVDNPTCRVLVTSPRLKDIEGAIASCGTVLFVEYDVVPDACERGWAFHSARATSVRSIFLHVENTVDDYMLAYLVVFRSAFRRAAEGLAKWDYFERRRKSLRGQRTRQTSRVWLTPASVWSRKLGPPMAREK